MAKGIFDRVVEPHEQRDVARIEKGNRPGAASGDKLSSNYLGMHP
jgi:hypothetical protein